MIKRLKLFSKNNHKPQNLRTLQFFVHKSSMIRNMFTVSGEHENVDIFEDHIQLAQQYASDLFFTCFLCTLVYPQKNHIKSTTIIPNTRNEGGEIFLPRLY